MEGKEEVRRVLKVVVVKEWVIGVVKEVVSVLEVVEVRE